MSTSDALAEFTRRIERDLLPTYCRARNYSVLGFRPSSIKIAPEDARNFLRALDGGLVEHLGNGRYRLPRSSATEVLFWEGLKAKTPRPIFLWLEPVITLASIARLHFDYGWPTELLGTQPATWAFDLSASLPRELESEHILGEVKKSSREIEVLLRDMQFFCSNDLPVEPFRTDPRRNAYKKWLRLQQCRSSLFWAIGPGGTSQLFEVERPTGKRIFLREVPLLRLQFPNVA